MPRMTPDDDSCKQAQKNRARLCFIGALLGVCALSSTVMYLVFLRKALSMPMLVALIAIEWLVMLFVFLIATSKMRSRKK